LPLLKFQHLYKTLYISVTEGPYFIWHIVTFCQYSSVRAGCPPSSLHYYSQCANRRWSTIFSVKILTLQLNV